MDRFLVLSKSNGIAVTRTKSLPPIQDVRIASQWFGDKSIRFCEGGMNPATRTGATRRCFGRELNPTNKLLEVGYGTVWKD